MWYNWPICFVNSGYNISLNSIQYNTVIFQYTSNWFTSFRLYDMRKLIPVFRFESQFPLIRAPSYRQLVVPGALSPLSSISETFCNAQNVTESLRGLRRSSSIAMYVIVINDLVINFLLSALTVVQRWNRKEYPSLIRLFINKAGT